MKKIFYTLLFFPLAIVAQVNVEFKKENFKDRKDELKDAINNIENGDDFFGRSTAYYSSALPFYIKANDFNPNNALLNFKIGLCYLHSSFKGKATTYLELAYKLNPIVAPDIHYWLARTYHLSMEWDKAIASYQKFLTVAKEMNNTEFYQTAGKKITECKNGKELVQKPVRVFIDNIGSTVNSADPEYGAVISADESVMMFTSRRNTTTGGGMDIEINQHYEDIYITYRKNGQWITSVNMGEPVNTKNRHDAVSSVSADGQTLLIYLDDKKNGSGNIYICENKNGVWGKPEKLNKNINSDYHESGACISPDGKTIYFTSDKPEGGLGKHDIFMSKLDEKGKWGAPVSLGTGINTAYDEDAVFIHPDGKTLYFSSEGHNSMGGLDVFKTVYDEKTKTWSKPENMGYPINSPDQDVFFVLSASGKHGYYTSIKPDGKGDADVYMITFLGAEKPPVMSNEDNLLASLTAPIKETVVMQKVDVTVPQLTLLKGIITDAITQKPLQATIELVDNTKNEIIATFQSNGSTGKYLVSLPAGKNYGIAVKCEGYLFHSENFDIPLTNGYQEVNKDVQLKNVKVGSKIVLKNIFFDTDKSTLRSESTAELERLIKLLNDIPTLKIEISGHTDSRGSDDHNLKLSDARAKAVVDYLVAKGISKDRLKSAGYGETKPIDSNDTEEGLQNNRRTEFEILSK